MLQNMFLNWLAKMVGKRFDGKKLKIGTILLFLYGIIEVLQKLFPDSVPAVPIKLSAQDWDTIISYFKDGVVLAGGATASVGVVHKAYKAGLVEPMPLTLQKPSEQKIAQSEPDALGDGTVEPEQKKWDGKVGGQFP